MHRHMARKQTVMTESLQRDTEGCDALSVASTRAHDCTDADRVGEHPIVWLQRVYTAVLLPVFAR